MTELVWEQRRHLLRNTPPFSDEAPDLEYAGCVYQWQPVTEISGGSMTNQSNSDEKAAELRAVSSLHYSKA